MFTHDDILEACETKEPQWLYVSADKVDAVKAMFPGVNFAHAIVDGSWVQLCTEDMYNKIMAQEDNS